jgi:L-lactate utilization protein LutB
MSVKDPLKETRRALGRSLCEALEKRGFHAHYASCAEDAAEIAAEIAGEGACIGIPGSKTVRDIGVIEILEKNRCVIHHHWQKRMSREERKKVLLDEFLSDCFITSCNAITRDGVMVSIDGTGNRLAAMSWAMGKIVYVVGINKVMPDLESAIARAKNIASPPNAARVGAETPCVKTGYCCDCNLPSRICNVMLIQERATIGRESHVIVVGEPLGY